MVPAEDLLHAIADGDLSAIDPLLKDAARARKAAGLGTDAVQLVEIAALAAVDAPPASWLHHLGAHDPGIEVEKVVGALIAVAPIVGTPRIVSAAANILSAGDLVEVVVE
jgi:alkylhydroperoxidase/carboxymuconolactone decarboxylase family protein YurZ